MIKDNLEFYKILLIVIAVADLITVYFYPYSIYATALLACFTLVAWKTNNLIRKKAALLRICDKIEENNSEIKALRNSSGNNEELIRAREQENEALINELELNKEFIEKNIA